MQRLHACVADFLASGSTPERSVVVEFERALAAAQKTVEKQQRELERAHSVEALFAQDFRAKAAFTTATQRYEALLIRHQKLQAQV